MSGTAVHRVVFDCNVLFQGLVSPNGPAGRCVAAALDERLELSASQYVLDELRDVASRAAIRAKFRFLTDVRVSEFIERVAAVAEFPQSVPIIYSGCRDPDDNHYLNLAIATNSTYVVSRDNDLLILRESTLPEARELRRLFPSLRIVEPVEMLRVMDG